MKGRRFEAITKYYLFQFKVTKTYNMNIIEFAGNTINEDHIVRIWITRNTEGDGVFVKMELITGTILEELSIDEMPKGYPALVNAEVKHEQLIQQIETHQE